MALELLEEVSLITVSQPYFILVLVATVLIFVVLRVFRSRIASIGIPLEITLLSMASSAYLIGSATLPLSIIRLLPILHATVSIIFSMLYALLIKYLTVRFVE